VLRERNALGPKAIFRGLNPRFGLLL
jgi:hypothetical protein